MTKETVLRNILSSAVSLGERSVGFQVFRFMVQEPPEENELKYPFGLLFGVYQFTFPATTRFMLDEFVDPMGSGTGRFIESSLGFSADVATNALIFAAFHDNLAQMTAWRIGANLITQISMDTIYALATKTRSLVNKQKPMGTLIEETGNILNTKTGEIGKLVRNPDGSPTIDKDGLLTIEFKRKGLDKYTVRLPKERFGIDYQEIDEDK